MALGTRGGGSNSGLTLTILRVSTSLDLKVLKAYKGVSENGGP